jgi:hypothetical protein
MRLSEDRISHISHLVTDGVWNDDLVDYTDEERALAEVKAVITEYLKLEDDADEAARNKINSLSKHVPEGSHEWNILYKKYFDDELERKRF